MNSDIKQNKDFSQYNYDSVNATAENIIGENKEFVLTVKKKLCTQEERNLGGIEMNYIKIFI